MKKSNLQKILWMILPLISILSIDGYSQAPWPGEGTNSGVQWVAYRNSDGSLVRDVSGEASISAVQDICYDDAAGHPASVLIACDGVNIFFRIMVGDKPTNVSGSIVNNVGYIVEIADANGVYMAAVALLKSSKDEIRVTNAAGTVSNAIYSSPTTGIRAVQVVPGSGTDTHWYVDFQTTLASITAVYPGFSLTTPTKYYFGTTAGASTNTINKDWMGGNVSVVSWSTISTAKPTSINSGTLYSSIISGSVTGAGSGVTMSYTDTTSKTTTTSGSYTYFIPVSYNWSGTVTPSKTGYTFTPVNKSYSNILTDQSSQNFAVDQVLISGTITSGAGSTINYTGGSTTANGSGYFEFWVTSGWTGTITPALTGYTFSPSSITLSSGVTAPLSGQNFTALLSPVISGKVLTQVAGSGVSGVTMTYTGTSSGTTTTNATGDYSVTVVSGSTENIAPSKEGYTFSPVSIDYTNVTTHQSSQNYTISSLRISGSTLVSGVTVSYFDGIAKQVTSDGSGNYSFWVPYNWSGSVTPAKTGLTFTTETVSNLAAPLNLNLIPTVNITGSTGVSGVIVTCQLADSTYTDTSDGTGAFSFTIPYNTPNAVVTPSSPSYIFSPLNVTLTNVTADAAIPPFGYVLPVEMISFLGKASLNNIRLDWATATEKNVYGFNIEKKKANGLWSQIGFVNGSGTSNSTKKYTFIDKNNSTGTYEYRLKITDNDGSFEYSKIIAVNIEAPKTYNLMQNYPNPFNPATYISYTLPADGFVTLTIYNIIGKEVAVIVNENRKAGSYVERFDASGLTSGVYIYRIKINDFVMSKSMTLVK